MEFSFWNPSQKESHVHIDLCMFICLQMHLRVLFFVSHTATENVYRIENESKENNNGSVFFYMEERGTKSIIIVQLFSSHDG